MAEYVVNREDERIVTFRLLDFDHESFAGVRYQASAGDPDLNRGIVPEDGWVTLAIPPGAKTVGISLYVSGNEDEEPIQMEFRVEEKALVTLGQRAARNKQTGARLRTTFVHGNHDNYLKHGGATPVMVPAGHEHAGSKIHASDGARSMRGRACGRSTATNRRIQS